MEFAFLLRSSERLSLSLRVEPGCYRAHCGAVEPRPGFGLGIIEDDLVRLERRLFEPDAPAYEEQFEAQTLLLSTAEFSPGLSERDLSPWRFFSWLSVCTGPGAPHSTTRRALRDRTLPFVATQRRGARAGEEVFQFLVSRLHEQAGIGSSQPSPRLLARGLGDTLRFIAEREDARAPSLNVLVTNGTLTALMRAGAPLCSSVRHAPVAPTQWTIPGAGVTVTLRRAASSPVILAATPCRADHERWTELAPGEIACFHSDGGDEVRQTPALGAAWQSE